MKKRWFTLCCIGVITAFAMVGCGSSSTESTTDSTVTEETATDEELRLMKAQPMKL